MMPRTNQGREWRRLHPWHALAVCALAFVVAAAVLAAGCDMPSTGGLGQVGGSGTLVTRQYDFSGFTKVTVDGAFRATIDYGEGYDVSVTVDDNLVKEHLKVELKGDTLHIGLAPLWRYHDVTLRATVVMPRLTGLQVNGAASAAVTGFATGDPLAFEVSGAGSLDLAEARFGAVTAEVSGAGHVDGEVSLGALSGEASGASVIGFTGSATTLRLDVSGASRLELQELTVEDADLTLSGGSWAAVLVTGTLNAEASGGSHLEYSGSPQLGSIDSSGGASIGSAQP